MKILVSVLLFAMTVSVSAQSADALYQRACGPKTAAFDVQLDANQTAPAAPEPGKALVYFIQKESGPFFTTRIGLDGSWAGVVLHDSYIVASVAPGEHHACAATLNRKHLEAELAGFTAEAGKTYYYVVRAIGSGAGASTFALMELGPADPDEALLLIASDLQSVATPKVRQ